MPSAWRERGSGGSRPGSSRNSRRASRGSVSGTWPRLLVQPGCRPWRNCGPSRRDQGKSVDRSVVNCRNLRGLQYARIGIELERVTRFELATSTLGRLHSTTELHPHRHRIVFNEPTQSRLVTDLLPVACHSAGRYRPHGTGSVFYDEDRRHWTAQINLGRGPGREKASQAASLFRTEADAKRAAAQAIKDHVSGIDLVESGQRFGDFCVRWLSDLEGSDSVAPGTFDKYRRIVKHHLSGLASSTVKDLATPTGVGHARAHHARRLYRYDTGGSGSCRTVNRRDAVANARAEPDRKPLMRIAPTARKPRGPRRKHAPNLKGDYLTIPEVGTMLGISRAQAYELVHRPGFPLITALGPKLLRVNQIRLDEWLERQRK